MAMSKKRIKISQNEVIRMFYDLAEVWYLGSAVDPKTPVAATYYAIDVEKCCPVINANYSPLPDSAINPIRGMVAIIADSHEGDPEGFRQELLVHFPQAFEQAFD